jgi:hypothetical protein
VVVAVIVASVICCLRRQRSPRTDPSASNSKIEATQATYPATAYQFSSQGFMSQPQQPLVQTPTYNPFHPAQNQYSPAATSPVDAMSTSGYALSVGGASAHPSVSPLMGQGGYQGYNTSIGAMVPGGIVEYSSPSPSMAAAPNPSDPGKTRLVLSPNRGTSGEYVSVLTLQNATQSRTTSPGNNLSSMDHGMHTGDHTGDDVMSQPPPAYNP